MQLTNERFWQVSYCPGILSCLLVFSSIKRYILRPCYELSWEHEIVLQSLLIQVSYVYVPFRFWGTDPKNNLEQKYCAEI